MTVAEVEVQPIQRVWSQAVAEYTAQLRKAGQTVDLEQWKDVQDIDDLVARLEVEHGTFDKDVGRGSKFTSALKAGFAPVTLLMNTLGGPASAAFAPCSQIFGAVTVLISAAKQTGAAFDDIAGLFNDLGRSTQLIKPLTKRKPPPQLESIIQGILVCLLTVCALATKRTCHVPEKAKHRSVKQVLSGVKSNMAEFGRQLLLGEDAEIGAAKANLRYLSESQAQLVGVLTLEKVGDIQEDMTRIGAVAIDVKDNTARMESVVVQINGLSLEISSAVVELQMDVNGMKIRLDEVGEVVSRIDFKLDDIRDNMLTKSDQKESLVMFNERFDRLEMLAKAAPSNAKKAKVALSKTAVMHSKRLQQLKARLKPESANRSFYKRIADGELIPGTGDWILQRPELMDWMEGKRPVLCISGDTGCGKTFLTARIVKHLLDTYPQGVQSPSAISLGYFFAKSELKELRSISSLLCTTAFQIAQNDRVYAGCIDVQSKELDLEDCSIGLLWQTLFLDYFGDARGTTFLVIDAIDECDEDDIEPFLEALKGTYFEQPKPWPKDLRLLLVHNSINKDDLTSALGDVASFMTLEIADMKDDITKAVDKKMTSAWSDKLVTPSFYDEVREAVLSAPQTNFLWSCLVVEDLTAISRQDVVRARLKSLPSDVNEAMLLLLSRLSRHLDEFAIEDLNDLLAWVECSHRFLSLAALDAILTLRKSGGARIINLDDLVMQDFAGLFISSTDDSASVWPSDEKVQQRLQDQRGTGDDTMSVADDVTVAGTDGGGEAHPPVAVAETSTDVNSAFDRKIDAWNKITVRLTHRLVKQYIEERIVKEDLKLTTHQMYVSVLIGSLKIICEPDPDQDKKIVDRANNYCAVYLPEHLSDVDPSTVDAEVVQTVVAYLLRMLRDKEIVHRWITSAAEYLTQDVLQKTEFRDSIISWFRAAQNLSAEDRAWVSEAVEAPVAVLFEPVSRFLTLEWLDTDEDDSSGPVVFIIEWLEMAKELRPSLSIDNASGDTYGLEDKALQILQTARWIGRDESAHFFQRVGDALRDDQFELMDAAKCMYRRGLELDDSLPRLHSGLAYACGGVAEHVEVAIPHMKLAAELCRTQLAAPDLAEDIRGQTNVLLQDCVFRLGMFYKWTSNVDECNSAFQSLLSNWEAEKDDDWGPSSKIGSIFWLESMQQRSDYVGASSVFKRMVAHPQALKVQLHVLYTHFIEYPDVLLQIAYETKTFEDLDKFWLNGMQVCARYGEDGEVSAIRFHRSLAILRLCPSRTDDAVSELAKIVADVEVARPSNEWHWVKERAERELARIYFQRALEARDEDRWHQVGVNIDELVRLCRTNPDADQAEIVNRECSSILAAWNRLNGQRARAVRCAKPKLEHGINVLTDSDPTNDLEAWQCFGDACLAVGDVERATSAVGMQKQLCRFGASAIEGVTEEVEAESDDEAEEENADEEDAKEEDAKEEDAKEEDAKEGDAEEDATPTEESEADGPEDAEDEKVSAVDSFAPSVNGLDKENAQNDELSTSTAAGQLQAEVDRLDAIADTNSSALPNGTKHQDLEPGQEDGDNEENKEDPEDDATGDEDEEDDDTLAYTCDGPCFKTIPNQQIFYRCSYCLTDFCQSCQDKLVNNQMEGFKICSSLHERHTMPALLSKFEPGCLDVAGKSVPIVEWLQDLKKAWDIPIDPPDTT